jgi:hypothetical protein
VNPVVFSWVPAVSTAFTKSELRPLLYRIFQKPKAPVYVPSFPMCEVFSRD